MAQWILKANGNVVPRRTVRPLTKQENDSNVKIKKRKLFDELIQKRYGTSEMPPPSDTSPNMDFYEDDDEELRAIPPVDDPVDSTGWALDEQPYDALINAKLMLPQGD